MTPYTPKLLSNHRLCSYGRLFAQIIEQTILTQITERTTAAQLAAAKFSVRALSQQLAAEAKRDWSHYPAEQGTHNCVRAVFTDAIFRLENIILMQPEPEPEQPPAAPQPQMTLEDVVKAFGEPVQPDDDATYLGTDEDEPDAW
jgi:hypothetical protein